MRLFSKKYTPKGVVYRVLGFKFKLGYAHLTWRLFRAPTIHFIHVCEPRNPGDMLSYPYLYFKKYFNRFDCRIHHTKDIKFETIEANDVVILASGGCFEVLDKFQEDINRLLDMCNNVISWGCGHNAHHDRPVYWPIDFEKFKLLSVRDFNYQQQRYCPCVLCMMSGLDYMHDISRRIGIIEHQDFPIDIAGEKISHKCNIQKILNFIGSSEIIITNTYHCAYWAMCMKKKVILYQPFSTKFDNFKHHPVIYSGDIEKDIAQSKVYPDFLKECRTINLQLFADVRKIIRNNRNAL